MQTGPRDRTCAVGFEGCAHVLAEDHGLLDAWGTDGGAETVVRGLGQDYAVMGANFKFMRAGYPIYAAVEAAATLIAQHDIAADAIASVRVGMRANAMRVVDNRLMPNICLQDMLSAALPRGGLSLSESYFPRSSTTLPSPGCGSASPYASTRSWNSINPTAEEPLSPSPP
jgi:2-methylcitrate dehydratase PrpD